MVLFDSFEVKNCPLTHHKASSTSSNGITTSYNVYPIYNNSANSQESVLSPDRIYQPPTEFGDQLNVPKPTADLNPGKEEPLIPPVEVV